MYFPFLLTFHRFTSVCACLPCMYSPVLCVCVCVCMPSLVLSVWVYMPPCTPHWCALTSQAPSHSTDTFRLCASQKLREPCRITLLESHNVLTFDPLLLNDVIVSQSVCSRSTCGVGQKNCHSCSIFLHIPIQLSLIVCFYFVIFVLHFHWPMWIPIFKRDLGYIFPGLFQ